jgi:hypothetical protein
LRQQAEPSSDACLDGCCEAWLLLDYLCTEIGIVHGALEDNKGNELSLAGYNRSTTLSVCTDVPQDEVWENVNPGFDKIIVFGRPKGEIAAMAHGSWVDLTLYHMQDTPPVCSYAGSPPYTSAHSRDAQTSYETSGEL